MLLRKTDARCRSVDKAGRYESARLEYSGRARKTGGCTMREQGLPRRARVHDAFGYDASRHELVNSTQRLGEVETRRSRREGERKGDDARKPCDALEMLDLQPEAGGGVRAPEKRGYARMAPGRNRSLRGGADDSEGRTTGRSVRAGRRTSARGRALGAGEALQPQ